MRSKPSDPRRGFRITERNLTRVQMGRGWEEGLKLLVFFLRVFHCSLNAFFLRLNGASSAAPAPLTDVAAAKMCRVASEP